MEYTHPLVSIHKTFKSKVYQIDLLVDEKSLKIQIKEHSGNCWVGEYSINFIETLCFKAGSSKKFNVFLNMIISALEGTSTSVIIDLETHADLEKIRNKPVLGNSNTIYLILTYISEFDKVYYPLPLQLKKNTDNINKLITYFEKEINTLNTQLALVIKEKSEILEENTKINEIIKSLKNNIELEKIEKLKIKTELEALKADTTDKIHLLNETIKDLQIKIKKNNFSQIENPSSSPNESFKQQNNKLNLENKVLKAEIKSLKALNKKNKLKIGRLQAQLEESKNDLKERSKSLYKPEPETPLRISNGSTRSKSTIRSSYNTTDITSKLEKIVNLLSFNEKPN
jgi:hypothetical protein